MNKRFPIAAALIVAASVLFSGCSSEESPSELDMLIEQLQTVQLTSETVPEEISEDVSEKTDEPVASESSEDSSQETTDTDDTEASSEETTPTESAEETSDTPEGNEGSPITYKSLTVTVISVEEHYILVELDGVVYKVIIDENTGIFGGEILKDKTVTVTYAMNEDGSETNIAAAAITVLP